MFVLYLWKQYFIRPETYDICCDSILRASIVTARSVAWMNSVIFRREILVGFFNVVQILIVIWLQIFEGKNFKDSSYSRKDIATSDMGAPKESTDEISSLFLRR